MKNKKAQIFAMLLVLAVIVVITYSLFTFITTQGFFRGVSSPKNLHALYEDSLAFEMFSSNAAEISIIQSYNSIAKQNLFAPKDAVYADNHINLTGGIVNTDQLLLIQSNNSLNLLIEEYPDNKFSDMEFFAAFENSKLSFNSQKKINTEVEGNFAYSAVYFFKPNLEFSLSKLHLFSFEEIYSEAKRCKALPTAEEIGVCINLGYYDSAVKIDGSKIFFDFSSKRNFLLDGKELTPIKISFFLDA
ncbi:MAG: hypothetical protein V1660_01530 [archaeon]